MNGSRGVIIVAGGSGTRMGTTVPKQFLCVAGKPVLQHTLETFYRFDATMCMVVVLPKEQVTYWQQLCKDYDCAVPHSIAVGGDTRFLSVRNGLAVVPSDITYIGVHDGVRPLVSSDTLQRCFAAVAKDVAVVPVTDMVDSLRWVDQSGNSRAVIRSEYKAVQTPQVFRAELLRRAYEQPYQTAFTDDASVVEAVGHNIVLVEGNRENIKITTPLDLYIAEFRLNGHY